jgi:hypothetical protein
VPAPHMAGDQAAGRDMHAWERLCRWWGVLAGCNKQASATWRSFCAERWPGRARLQRGCASQRAQHGAGSATQLRAARSRRRVYQPHRCIINNNIFAGSAASLAWCCAGTPVCLPACRSNLGGIALPGLLGPRRIHIARAQSQYLDCFIVVVKQLTRDDPIRS